MRKLNLADNIFDVVTMWDVVEHFISPMDELKEIYRILKPDGKLYISTPNHRKGMYLGSNWFGYNASYEHLFYFESSTLARMLSKIGFSIDESFSHEANDMAITNVKCIGHILMMSARK